jgi:riboflavin kinase/FMN adenylyltransferase
MPSPNTQHLTPNTSCRWLHDLPVEPLPSLALTIGVFDGVHAGHQALLAAAKEAGTATGSVAAALTFDPHPSAVFAPSRVPPLLGTLDERAALLRQYGAEEVIVARFDRGFAAQTPEEFIQSILLDRLRVRAVIVGDDFRFGRDRAGNLELLRTFGERFGFAVRVVPPVFVNGVPARSTTIRQMLSGGEVAEAARLLGRPYSLSGTVVHGKQLGRTLGFPTANLAAAPNLLIPSEGIYAGRAHLPRTGETFRAAISIGTNPTVTPDNPLRTVEAYLMDGFDRDLYDRPLTIEFLHRLRGTEKFDSLDALVAQMRRDVEQARRLVA